MSEKLILTETDMNAIALCDANYINNKGAKLYNAETYDRSVEYYRLAAAMGNVHAISNLGYCYLYGRSIEQNTSLAIAYFKIASMRGDVDAAYKLGDIYSRDKWVEKDSEMSIYYYRMAITFILGDDADFDHVMWCNELQNYPSLCYAFARELAPGGTLCTDINVAYQYLKHAQLGYEKCLANGEEMYKESYEGVLKMLQESYFDLVRDKIEVYSENDDDEDDLAF